VRNKLWISDVTSIAERNAGAFEPRVVIKVKGQQVLITSCHFDEVANEVVIEVEVERGYEQN